MCFILIAVDTVHTGKSVEYVSCCFSYVLYRSTLDKGCLENTVFWCVKLCSSLEIPQRFGRLYCLQFQGRYAKQVKGKRKAASSKFLQTVSKLLPDCVASHPCRQYHHEKSKPTRGAVTVNCWRCKHLWMIENGGSNERNHGLLWNLLCSVDNLPSSKYHPQEHKVPELLDWAHEQDGNTEDQCANSQHTHPANKSQSYGCISHKTWGHIKIQLIKIYKLCVRHLSIWV
jgi:hypothetical protein